MPLGGECARSSVDWGVLGARARRRSFSTPLFAVVVVAIVVAVTLSFVVAIVVAVAVAAVDASVSLASLVAVVSAVSLADVGVVIPTAADVVLVVDFGGAILRGGSDGRWKGSLASAITYHTLN